MPTQSWSVSAVAVPHAMDCLACVLPSCRHPGTTGRPEKVDNRIAERREGVPWGKHQWRYEKRKGLARQSTQALHDHGVTGSPGQVRLERLGQAEAAVAPRDVQRAAHIGSRAAGHQGVVGVVAEVRYRKSTRLN